MKALVYHGPGQRSWHTVADPTRLVELAALVMVPVADVPSSSQVAVVG